MPLAQGDVRDIGTTIGQPFAVPALRCGDHQHAGPSVMGAPTQVEVLAVEVDGRIESPEGPEQVGAHEQTGRWQREHVTDRVVLLLVGLAGLDEGVELTESVDSVPDVLQHLRVVPVDELRPDDTGVRAEELLHHEADRIGLERHVVVEQAEEPVVALDETHHLVRRRAVPGIAVDRAHVGGRQQRSDPPRDVPRVARDEEQVPKVRVLLRRQRSEHLVEPLPWLVDHHHRHDGGRKLVGGLHEGARLAVRITHPPVTTDIVVAGPRVEEEGTTMNIFPNYDLTDFDLGRIDVGRLGRLAREAGYVAVGAGVLGVQRANVRRRDLERTLRTQAPDLAAALGTTQQLVGSAIRLAIGTATRGR